MTSSFPRIGQPASRGAPRRIAALAMLLLVAVAGGAEAQVDRQAAQSACRPDVESVCAGVRPGGGRIVQCLRQNASRLSRPCQAALAGRQ